MVSHRKRRLKKPSPPAANNDTRIHEDDSLLSEGPAANNDTRIPEDDSLLSEGEEGNTPEYMSSGELSDCSLESRYLNSWCELPSVDSRRQTRRAAFKRWKPTVSPECQLVRNRTQPLSCDTPSRVLLHARPSVVNVELFAQGAGSSGHNVPSSTVNNDALDEGEDAPKEWSVSQAVYYVVLVSGRVGISEEDVLDSLHGQSCTACTDWEANVKQCLKSRLFAQVQGRYVVRKHCPSSSEGTESGDDFTL